MQAARFSGLSPHYPSHLTEYPRRKRSVERVVPTRCRCCPGEERTGHKAKNRLELFGMSTCGAGLAALEAELVMIKLSLSEIDLSSVEA